MHFARSIKIVGCLVLGGLSPLGAGTSSALATGSDTDFHLVWTWSVGGDAVGFKGLEMVDLDADGRAEILVAANLEQPDGHWYVLEHREGALEQIYSSLPRADGIAGVASGSEAGLVRIVVAGRTSLSVYDGPTRRELASFPTVSQDNVALAVGDVDNDGILDAVLCDANDLYVYELLFGTVRTKFGFGCGQVALGQTDTDPQLEIALAGNPSGGFVLDGASLNVDWADVRGFGFRVCLGDFDADGRDEVASIVSFSRIRVQDPESGDLLWEYSPGSVGVLAAANLDGEPGSELLYAETYWSTIHVLDGATETELETIESPEGYVSKIVAGDTDADGVLNLLWSTGIYSAASEHLYLARSDSGEIEARTEDWSGPFSGLEVGDFEGTGALEVATATSLGHAGSYGGAPLVLSFADGRLKRFPPQDWNTSSTSEILGVDSAQLDADAPLELCLFSHSGVGCFDGLDFSEQWWVSQSGRRHAMAIGELDGGGVPEVLVGDQDALVFAFEGDSGWLKWRTPPSTPSYPGIYGLRLLDVLGDSRQEVLASSNLGPNSRIWGFDAFSGLVAAGPWTTDVQSMNPSYPTAGTPELLVGRSTGEIVPFDPMTGIAGPAIATFPGPVEAFGFADFDRDGAVDVAALLGDHFEVQDGESGLTLYVGPHLGSNGIPPESFLVGDFDGNTVPEILVATAAGVALFKAPVFLVFTDGFESGDTSNW